MRSGPSFLHFLHAQARQRSFHPPPSAPGRITKIYFKTICYIILWLPAVAAAAGFAFAALGDVPYSQQEAPRFIAMLARIDREPLAFVVHVGDFKSGHDECSDEIFEQRKQWFESSRHPFIYVPGDNDWTDCWRRAAGEYPPLERLRRVRELFFAGNSSLGRQKIDLTRQIDVDPAYRYPEHARWSYGGVLFVTLNVPGSYNNYTRDRAEFRARDTAVRAWIAGSFRLAREQRLGGVALMMQADPWAAVGPLRHVYAPLLEAITAETLAFPGEVVLIHGDTHRFRFDHPLLDPDTHRRIANFTRIEVFGDPNVNWVRVSVREENGRVRFEAEPGDQNTR